jgi:hypothetical protein
VTHLPHVTLPTRVGQDGEQAKRRNQTLGGQRADRRLLSVVEFDAGRWDAEQHGDDAVAASQAADSAAVAVDQHDELPSTPNVPN